MTTFNKVQQMYNEYAFTESLPAEPENSRNEEDGAYNLMVPYINRTYESPFKWYLVVFKPYDKPYEQDREWFRFKGLSSCRNLFKKCQVALLTREIYAAKIHINAVVCTDQDLMRRHDTTYNNRYKIDVSELHRLCDRQNSLIYITKEEKDRSFANYLDYIISSAK